MARRRIGPAFFGVVLLALAIQVLPYGRDHANPPVRLEPRWDSQQTRQLAARACLDCHGNETSWPLYSSIAPVSWLIQRDVEEGREVLNFSEWDRPQREAREAAETVLEGEMPPAVYQMTHPEARLSPSERRALAQGLQATLGADPGPRGRRSGRERDED